MKNTEISRHDKHSMDDDTLLGTVICPHCGEEHNYREGVTDKIDYIITEKDKTGGSGANFIVVWKSDTYVNPPIVETIMISTKGQQGISFTSRGQVIIQSN